MNNHHTDQETAYSQYFKSSFLLPSIVIDFPKYSFFQFAFPSSVCKILSSSISSVPLSFVKIFNFGYSKFFKGCVMLCFILQFLITNETSMFSCVYWPLVYPLL